MPTRSDEPAALSVISMVAGLIIMFALLVAAADAARVNFRPVLGVLVLLASAARLAIWFIRRIN